MFHTRAETDDFVYNGVYESTSNFHSFMLDVRQKTMGELVPQ